MLLGCFREGLALLERIEAELPELRRRILVIDYNPALQERLESAGFDWAYGDLAHPETLTHLGLAHARVVVSTIPDSFLKGTSNSRLMLHAKQIAPAAHFIVTAEDDHAAEELRALGAADVVVPAVAAAERLLALVAAQTGPSRQVVPAREREPRVEPALSSGE